MAQRFTRRNAIKAMSAASAISLAGCTSQSDGGTTETTNAAWIYVGLAGDIGWSQQHDLGRQAVQEQFDWVETDYVEDVPPSDVNQVVDQLGQDNDVVFGTTFDYSDAMLTQSQDDDETAYEHCNGIEAGDNMGIYYGKMYQARYLCGVAAGLVTETDTIGFVASFPISHVLREINGFAKGVMDVNSEATIKVRWTNAWFDPPKSRRAAESLLDENVDVTAQVQDSSATVKTASENDVWSTGSNAPMRQFGGDKYLTSGIWNWGPYYTDAVESVHDGNWEPDFDFPGISTGIVELDEWGPAVPDSVKSEVETRREELVNGERSVWQGSKFEGEGDEFLYYDMGSYISNIEGQVPES